MSTTGEQIFTTSQSQCLKEVSTAGEQSFTTSQEQCLRVFQQLVNKVLRLANRCLKVMSVVVDISFRHCDWLVVKLCLLIQLIKTSPFYALRRRACSRRLDRPTVRPTVYLSHIHPEYIYNIIESNLMKLDILIEGYKETCRMQKNIILSPIFTELLPFFIFAIKSLVRAYF